MVKGKKRSVTVVLSSSDSEKDRDFKVKHTKSKSESKSASVPRANAHKRSKRTSFTNSSNPWLEESPAADFDRVKKFCEEFDEGVARFQGSAGNRSIKDLWVNKYKPRTLQELAVHKKKVDELKTLIEERLTTTGLEGQSTSHVILITGPAGVGKSATVQTIASTLGASVCEWNMPTPTLWQEYLHNSNSGLRYTSKLDEFEDFVERIRKYGIMSSTSAIWASRTPVILLIDDLPVINGKLAYSRLHRCLHLLVQSVRVPTVILITDYGNDESLDYTSRYLEDIQSSFQGEGVRKVSFNPVTVNSIKKVLSRICREEYCDVSSEQIESIAKASGGDIRNALTSLQYFCLMPHQRSSIFSNDVSSRSKERLDKSNDWRSLSFGRDENVSLFHALGKFLHNKRENQNPVSSGIINDIDALPLKEELVRLPLNMEAPEVILHQAHWQSRPIADFLHENVLDFISEEAIDDAWAVSSYLSDADLLMSSLNGRVSRNFEAANAVQSAAASVAVRGVLFGNSHPGPSRWHAIRRPKLWHVEQSLRQEKNQITSWRGNTVNFHDFTSIVTEFNPVLRRIGYRGPEETTNIVEDELDMMDLDETDEIEDW